MTFSNYIIAAKATNPLNRDEDWDFILAFCDQINKELEGPQIAVRLLAHKIQSPQQKEALFALSVSISSFSCGLDRSGQNSPDPASGTSDLNHRPK
jgi:hypothetical protein